MTRAERCTAAILRIPWVAFAGVLILFGLIRNGLAFEVAGQEPDPVFPLPQPGMTPLSYGVPSVVWALNIQGSASKIGLVMLAATVLFLVWVVWASRGGRRTAAAYVIAAAIVLGPVGVVAMGNVGRHDLFLLAGSVALGLYGKRWYAGAIGAALMVLGNPEQAFIALLFFLPLTLIRRLKSYRSAALWALGVSFSSLLVLTLWSRSLGVPTRFDFVVSHLHPSLLNFFGNFPISLYAAYGVTWIVIGWAAINSSWRDRILLLIFAVLGPLGVTAMTLDQTRVFVGVSTVTITALLAVSVGPMLSRLRRASISGGPAWALLLIVTLPAVEVTYDGAPRVMYFWIYDQAVRAGILSSLGIGPW